MTVHDDQAREVELNRSIDYVARRREFTAELAAARLAILANGGTGVEYYDEYLRAWAHQRECPGGVLIPSIFGLEQPSRRCMSPECVRTWLGIDATYPPGVSGVPTLDDIAAGDMSRSDWDVCRRYSWAVPNVEALETIREVSPAGVVEIGAGGGYWAYELGRRGVAVVAFDPAPPDGDPDGDRWRGHEWHHGRAWSTVLPGDHRAAQHYPERALFLCWPLNDADWSHEAVEQYHRAGGTTVIYVGDGRNGVTGTDRMLERLGLVEPVRCIEHEVAVSVCGCAATHTALFEPFREVTIPCWAGETDRLTVCLRRTEEATP